MGSVFNADVSKICDRLIEKGVIAANDKERIVKNESLKVFIIILARLGIL